MNGSIGPEHLPALELNYKDKPWSWLFHTELLYEVHAGVFSSPRQKTCHNMRIAPSQTFTHIRGVGSKTKPGAFHSFSVAPRSPPPPMGWGSASEMDRLK